MTRLHDRAGHDDPLGHGRVPPVCDHHPRLPALRHAAQVHVQEGLALTHTVCKYVTSLST